MSRNKMSIGASIRLRALNTASVTAVANSICTLEDAQFRSNPGRGLRMLLQVPNIQKQAMLQAAKKIETDNQ